MVAIEEQALLNDVRNLKPQALEQTHKRYYPAIFRYIAFKVGNRQTAEDLTSEVFLRLLDAVRDRHTPQKTLKGWLYSVASNIVSDYYRSQYRHNKDLPLTERLQSGRPEPAEQLINKETLRTLQEALSHLTDDQRTVIELRYGLEMSIKDVAHTLNKSEGAVKMLQARAIAALAKLLPQ